MAQVAAAALPAQLLLRNDSRGCGAVDRGREARCGVAGTASRGILARESTATDTATTTTASSSPSPSPERWSDSTPTSRESPQSQPQAPSGQPSSMFSLRPTSAPLPPVQHVESAMAAPSRRPPNFPGAAGLLEQLREEWRTLAGRSERLSKAAVVRAWRGPQAEGSRCGSTMSCSGQSPERKEDLELLAQSAEDLFNKVDLGRTGNIEEAEWLHYRLLEIQAPSFQALAEVSELVLTRIRSGDRRALERLLYLFEDYVEDPVSSDPRLTPKDMHRAFREWLATGAASPTADAGRVLIFRDTSVKWRGGEAEPATSPRSASSGSGSSGSGDVLDTPKEQAVLTYYDFLNRLLGRRSSKVQLYLYDLTNGKASWLSPLLFGPRLEGIWHTSVVAHGKEYWFGGRVFESEPGRSQFGVPDRIVELGETMRTAKDVEGFINRELLDEFTAASYDVLTRNCNHFSEEVCRFLTNQHIPEDVLRQPELVLGSPTAQVARPLVNWWFGNVGHDEAEVFDKPDTKVNGGSAAPQPTRQQPTTRRASEHCPKACLPLGACLGAATADQPEECCEEMEVTRGRIVAYEYEPGWTCIARVVRIGDGTCDLRWYNPRGGRLHILRVIGESQVHTLQNRDQRKTKHRPGGGGVFGACYHPVIIL